MDIVAQVLAAIMIIAGGVISYKQERNTKLKNWVLLLPLIGAVLSFSTGYKSSHDANHFQDTLRRRDVQINTLLNKNLKSAKKIIDSLDTAIRNSRGIISQNNTILNSQSTSLKLVNEQLVATAQVQNSVLSSEKNLYNKIKTTENSLDKDLTGGNAYPAVEISNMGDGTYEASVINNFNNVLPNVTIKIENYSATENCPFVIENNEKIYSMKCFDENSLHVPTDNYSPGIPHLLMGSRVYIKNDNVQRKLLFQFILPKTEYLEEMIYRLYSNKGGQFYYRILKIKGDNSTVVGYSKTSGTRDFNWDKEFPRQITLHVKYF